ncbi:MAG: VOC family protein [Pseudomonadota bacterium]
MPNTRIVSLVAVLTLSALAQAPASAADATWRTDGLDHIMLWTADIDRATAVFAVKLGFQVRPGGDFGDGVANRMVRLGEQSYIELLYTTKPRAELDDNTREDLDALHSDRGARTFAIHPLDFDALDGYLRKRGFDLDLPSPLTFDPDGEGPRPPVTADWRIASFAKSPVTFGDLFFISYAESNPTAIQSADRAITSIHPNGTQSWSSIWVLSKDIAADRKALEKMGFVDRGEVEMTRLNARGVRLEAGPDSIVLLVPKGEGIAAQALAKRGTHVLGLSLAVKDLARTQRMIERGYGLKLEQYAGLEGDSILAPTYDDVGLLFEFHGLSR